MKLLNEIVDLLMNESGSLNEALLKTKVLLHRIGQKELVGWVNDEINGYEDVETVPPYRQLEARVIGNITNSRFRYSNYTLPVMHLDPHIRDFLQKAPMGQSLGVLETLVGDGKDSLRTPTPPELLSALSEALGGYTVVDAWSQIQQSQVRQILIEVRSRLLDFVLALQDEIGDSMTDDDAKKATARLDVAGLFHGAVFGDNVTIMVGHNGQQHVHNTNVKHDVGALAAELRRNGVGEDDIDALNSAIAQDPVPAAAEEYGPAVKGWMSRMYGKALDGSWDVGVSVAGTLLAAVLQKYYGLPG
jgi:hypothetical protein